MQRKREDEREMHSSKKGRFDYFGSGYEKKNETGFVGLTNQGATCYLNSLIQSLFMTPEFRSSIYNWQYNQEKDGEESESIPFQLQKLFAKLEKGSAPSVSTQELTRSFGWTGADSFTQHDVQELNRVLFDALERSYKGSPLESFVRETYQGKLKDYIKCKECKNESSRVDNFEDLSLVIRSFEGKVNRSVEEALRHFITPETLDGDNQYECEKCGKKVDAVKGLCITAFPKILSFQIKRFDFDYTTLRRQKLNDYFEFPEYLSVAEFLQCQDPPTPQSPTPTAAPEDYIAVDGYSPDRPAPDPTGTLYELFSVLIHSGSALGGHYYAYIKAVADGRWYKFNDSTVTPLLPGDIEHAFGQKPDANAVPLTGPGARWVSSANAYMLLYRRHDGSPQPQPDYARLPLTIREEIAGENQAEEERYRRYLDELNKGTVNVFLKPSLNIPLRVDYNITLADLLSRVVEALDAHTGTDYQPFKAKLATQEPRLRHLLFPNQLPAQIIPSADLAKTLFDLEFSKSQSLFLEMLDQTTLLREDTLSSPDDLYFGLNVFDPTSPSLKEKYGSGQFEHYITVFAKGEGQEEGDEGKSESSGGVTVGQICRSVSTQVTGGSRVRLFHILNNKLYHYAEMDKHVADMETLLQGHILTAEICGDGEDPADLSHSVFFAQFQEEDRKFRLSYTPLAPKTATHLPPAAEHVVVDKTSTVGELRQMIAHRHPEGPPLSALVLKPSKYGVVQLGDDEVTLEKAGLRDGATIYPARGLRLRSDEVALRVHDFPYAHLRSFACPSAEQWGKLLEKEREVAKREEELDEEMDGEEEEGVGEEEKPLGRVGGHPTPHKLFETLPVDPALFKAQGRAEAIGLPERTPAVSHLLPLYTLPLNTYMMEVEKEEKEEKEEEEEEEEKCVHAFVVKKSLTLGEVRALIREFFHLPPGLSVLLWLQTRAHGSPKITRLLSGERKPLQNSVGSIAFESVALAVQILAASPTTPTSTTTARSPPLLPTPLPPLLRSRLECWSLELKTLSFWDFANSARRKTILLLSHERPTLAEMHSILPKLVDPPFGQQLKCAAQYSISPLTPQNLKYITWVDCTVADVDSEMLRRSSFVFSDTVEPKPVQHSKLSFPSSRPKSKPAAPKPSSITHYYREEKALTIRSPADRAAATPSPSLGLATLTVQEPVAGHTPLSTQSERGSSVPSELSPSSPPGLTYSPLTPEEA